MVSVIMDPGDFAASAFTFTILFYVTSAYPPSLLETAEMDDDSFTRTHFFQLEPSNFTITASKNGTSEEDSSNTDTMPILWYLISFGGLITFFLLLSFSEFCCRQKTAVPEKTDVEADPVPPPPYELFAPPNYDSLFRSIGHEKKRRPSIFLIPVHNKQQEVRGISHEVCDSSNDFQEKSETKCLDVHEPPQQSPLEFGEVIRRNPMGDGEVVTPPPPP